MIQSATSLFPSGFSIKICNSECEEPQTRPPGPGTDTEEIQATDIQRPPRAQEPQENHRVDYHNPPKEEQGRIPGKPPSSRSAEPQGDAATSPQTRRQPSMPEQIQPWTQRPETYHSPSRGPTEPRGPGPGKQPPGGRRTKEPGNQRVLGKPSESIPVPAQNGCLTAASCPPCSFGVPV
ncbi:hypothetical protein ILYODFUR_031044 [Ilyodon furcidens]|uniref:Uncharacterized protein n=1 Tax=Ilyodon furcidens TaxID=33524 RepID=A0ABV0U2Y2_9TELE